MMKKILFAAAASILLAACSATENLPLESTKWNLTELEGATNEAFADSESFWFALDGEGIIGVGACNHFFGGYQFTEDGGFEVGALGMTRMACPEMDIEDNYLRILDEVDSYSIEGDVLTLKKGEQALAQFKGEIVQPEGEIVQPEGEPLQSEEEAATEQ